MSSIFKSFLASLIFGFVILAPFGLVHTRADWYWWAAYAVTACAVLQGADRINNWVMK